MANELSASYSKALELHNRIMVSAQLAQTNLWDMCAGLKEMRDGKLYKELGYSNFEEYCGTEFNMTAGNARRYISIIENIPEENRAPVHGFGLRKLYLLSTLSEPEQAEIIEKTEIESATVRELEEEIKNLRQSNWQKKGQIQSLNGRLEDAHNNENKYRTELSQANVENRKLREQIEELESRPVEVAVAEPSEDVRQLKLAIKNLEQTTEKQLDDLQEEHLAAERRLRQEHEKDLEIKLGDQAKYYEQKLAKAEQQPADDKQVFKAYFTAAYDTFNRMLEYARQSPDKPFFREKINKLITSLSAATENL